MVRRREILIPNEAEDLFRIFYQDIYPGRDLADSKGYDRDHRWMYLSVDDEFMVMAKLKFAILELPPFGISVEFTD